MTRNLCVVLTCMQLAFQATSSAAGTVDLLQLDLEQLMTIQVVSSRPETVREAPAIVSTYSADELIALGLQDLRDFLDFAPGVQVNLSSSSITPIAVRGLWDNHNQKILLLIDGVPSWSSANADIPLAGIPLAAIDRIEVMRGPASVIYGTNASAGVINVVTHKSAKNLQLSLGEYDYRNVGGVSHHSFDDGSNLALAYEFQSEAGFDANMKNAFSAFDPSCGCFPANSNGPLTLGEDKRSLYAAYAKGGFKASLLNYQVASTGSSDGTLSSTQTRVENGRQLGLSYEKDINQLRVSFFSDWENSYADHDVKNITLALGFPGDGEISFDNDGRNNIRWRSGVRTTYRFNENYSVLSGLEYEQRSSEDRRFINYDGIEALADYGFQLQDDGSILLVEGNSIYEQSGYLELNAVSEYFNFKAGFRYINNSEFGGKTTPSFSIVKPFGGGQSLKLVYAVGFNSPTFAQTGATDQFGLPVDAQLSAEWIDSLDLAYTRTSGRHHFVVNAFKVELRDGIVQSGVYSNASDIDREGVEVEYQFRTRSFKVFLGGSYLFGLEGNNSASDKGDVLAAFAPKWQLDTGVSYSLANHQIGASIRAAGERLNVQEYFWLNVRYQYRIGDWGIFATLENALANDIEYPDVRTQNAFVIQGVDKQRVSLGVSFKY